MKKIDELGEFGLIQELVQNVLYKPEYVKVGPGDDGAVYHVPDGFDQVISTDTMVENIHFSEKTMKPFDVGYKLAASTISDMAAMGAIPIGIVVAASLPKDLPLSWAEECYKGIKTLAQKEGVNILGGDTTGSLGSIVLTGTVVGIVPKDEALLRSGAKEGDLVFVTGNVGDSGGGLYALLHGLEKEFPLLVEKHQRPNPEISFGNKLRTAKASSLNDISDGLSSELNEIAEASHVHIVIERKWIPLSAELQRLGEKENMDPLHFAFEGGEDYGLVGTISEENFQKMDSLGITIIGRVTNGNKGVWLTNGERLTPKGYNHFK